MQINSPTKLLSQIPSLLGYAEFTLESTSVQWPETSPQATCMLFARSRDSLIQRKTCNLSFDQNMTWNESFEFRCGLDWYLELAMIVEDSDGDEVMMMTERIPIESSGSVSQLLYLDNCCVGEVSFMLTFFPNYQSFKCLALDSTLSPSLPLKLTNEMLRLIEREYYERLTTSNDKEDDDNEDEEENPTIQVSNEERAMLFLVGKQFKDYLCDPSQLSDYIYKLYVKSNSTSAQSITNGAAENDGNKPGNNSNNRSNRSNNNSHDRDNEDEEEDKNSRDAITVPLHKVANVAKSFLSALSVELQQAPPVTINLIEKQLALYIDSILTTTYNSAPATSTDTTTAAAPLSPNVSYLFSPNASIGKEKLDFSATGGSVVDGYNSENKTFSWKQLISFCVISALWLLQQTLSTSDLLIENNSNNTNDDHDQDHMGEIKSSPGTSRREGENTHNVHHRTPGNLRLTLPELDALRFGFSLYDSDLSGEMPSSDLYYLLQDMGEEYTPSEVELILEDINPDGIPCIEFYEFVRWWCE